MPRTAPGRRMSVRGAVLATALVIALGGRSGAADVREEPAPRREAPHYESPILSLLLLPVNLLIRAVSMLEPKDRKVADDDGEGDRAR